MKRHAALIPLTHDHHHVLAQARRLRLAAAQPDEERREVTEAFLEFFRAEGIRHFREEEEVIFPLAVATTGAVETLGRVMIEHLQMHSLVRHLAQELEEGSPAAETMTRTSSLFERHARFEEKVVFPMIESIAGEKKLDSVRVRETAMELDGRSS